MKMIDREKVKDAFSNCIAEPKCKDCPWEQCESSTEKRIRIPASLCHDVMEMLIDAPTIVPNNTMPTIGGWISVKDRLPEEKVNWITMDYQQVICCCDFGGDPVRIDVRTYGFGKGHFWHGPQIMDGVITHWMPLPSTEGLYET